MSLATGLQASTITTATTCARSASSRCRATCTRATTWRCRRRRWPAPRAFVGTYGGFSYLAPFLGVPATAYYSNVHGFSARHLVMARSALASIGAGGSLDVRADAAATLRPLK